jgi:hypothetical protein
VHGELKGRRRTCRRVCEIRASPACRQECNHASHGFTDQFDFGVTTMSATQFADKGWTSRRFGTNLRSLDILVPRRDKSRCTDLLRSRAIYALVAETTKCTQL